MRTRPIAPLRRVVAATAVTVGLVVSGACGGGGAADPATVTDAWAVTVGDGDSAAVYATITAAGGERCRTD